jgi:CRISPR/Cas system-associated exonuclease Cas4 (RecB family)
MTFFADAYMDILRKMGKEGHQPSASIKPSSLFCIRKMTFDLLQIKPKFHTSPESILRMEDGKAVHEMVQKHLDRHLPTVRPGWTFQFEVRLTPENCARAADLFIRCSLDGFGTGPAEGDRRVLEIKETGDSVMATLRAPKKDHLEQLNTYLYLIDCREGEIIYFNRSNLSDMRPFDHIFDPELWGKTKEKIERAMAAAMEGRIPPTDVNEFFCRDCLYSHSCTARKEWVDAPPQD